MRNDRMLLEDIQEAIAIVLQYTPDARSAFDADPPLQSHLIRHIQIIGEAAWRLSDAFKNQHPEVPWRRIAAMRHVLVHDYFRVDLDQVWIVATIDIPALQPQLDAIVNAMPADEENGL